jgi:sugar/nucleoside kinase (ribokinase family)
MRDFPCLLEKDGGERLIHAFPGVMLTALGQLTPDQIQAAAAKWAATAELSCSPAEIRPVIEGMVRLARLAVASGRGLYLWNCV